MKQETRTTIYGLSLWAIGITMGITIGSGTEPTLNTLITATIFFITGAILFYIYKVNQ